MTSLVNDHNKSKYLKQGSQEWFDARQRIPCTASNTGAVFGLSPFNKPKDVAAIFDGEHPFTGNAACRYGTYSEDVAIEAVEKHLQIKIEETGLWINDKQNINDFFIYPQSKDDKEQLLKKKFLQEGIAGSPDGLVLFSSNKKIKNAFNSNYQKIIEVKCTHSALFPKFIGKTAYYMHQCQLNALIVNVPSCLFISYTPFGCGVWDVPRADCIEITPEQLFDYEIVQNEDHLQHLISLQLYCPNKQRLIGYKRIFMSVLFEFYKECQKPKEERMDWEKWEFEHHIWTRIINNTHKFIFDHTPTLYHQVKNVSYPLKRINWTALLTWQLDLMDHKLILNASIERFGLVSSDLENPISIDGTNTEKLIIHALDLKKCTIPFPSTGKHGFIDIYYPNHKGKLARKCFEVNMDTFPNDISYTPWDRQRKLPLSGLCILTIIDGQNIIYHYAGEWEPILHVNSGYYEWKHDNCRLRFNHQTFLNWQLQQ